jgi:signal peptidase II
VGAGEGGGVTPVRLGTLITLTTLVLDQGAKYYLLFGYDLPVREPLILTRFLEFLVVWNRGISYGLFQQHTEIGRWVLLAISVGAAIGLSIWMARVPSRLLAASLGLIIGGAIGNAIDRVVYGAVFDFVHVHLGSWDPFPYVFNVADAAIVAGVIGLVYEAFAGDKRLAGQANPGIGPAKPP